MKIDDFRERLRSAPGCRNKRRLKRVRRLGGRKRPEVSRTCRVAAAAHRLRRRRGIVAQRSDAWTPWPMKDFANAARILGIPMSPLRYPSAIARPQTPYWCSDHWAPQFADAFAAPPACHT